MNTGPHGPFNYPNFKKVEQKLNGPYDLRKILREAGAHSAVRRVTENLRSIESFNGMLGRGAQKNSINFKQHERGRLWPVNHL